MTMCTSSIQFELPFCRRHEDAKKTGCNARITAFVLGVIFFIVGFLALCEGFGNSMGMDNPAWAFGLVAILLIVGSSTHFKKNQKENTVDFNNQEWWLSDGTSEPLSQYQPASRRQNS